MRSCSPGSKRAPTHPHPAAAPGPALSKSTTHFSTSAPSSKWLTTSGEQRSTQARLQACRRDVTVIDVLNVLPAVLCPLCCCSLCWSGNALCPATHCPLGCSPCAAAPFPGQARSPAPPQTAKCAAPAVLLLLCAAPRRVPPAALPLPCCCLSAPPLCCPACAAPTARLPLYCSLSWSGKIPTPPSSQQKPYRDAEWVLVGHGHNLQPVSGLVVAQPAPARALMQGRGAGDGCGGGVEVEQGAREGSGRVQSAE